LGKWVTFDWQVTNGMWDTHDGQQKMKEDVAALGTRKIRPFSFLAPLCDFVFGGRCKRGSREQGCRKEGRDELLLTN
jgi:hypothetical protein